MNTGKEIDFYRSLPVAYKIVKSGLNEKRYGKMGIIYCQPGLMSFLKRPFHF